VKVKKSRNKSFIIFYYIVLTIKVLLIN